MSVELAGYLGLGIVSAAIAGALREDAPIIAPSPSPSPPVATLPPSPVVTPTPTPAPTPAPAAAAGMPAQLAAFIAQYAGRWVDWDHAYGAQCVDLANLWAVKLGIETFGGDAYSFQFDPHPDCVWIANTPTNYPSPGDVVVWRRNGALKLGFGHVAIAAKDIGVMRLTTFDQNWPLNAAPHFVVHSYTDVAGWMHPRKLPRAGRGGAWF